MRATWDIFKMGCRAALWKVTPSPPAVGLPVNHFLGHCFRLYVRAEPVCRNVGARPLHGLWVVLVVAWKALALVIVALFFPPRAVRRPFVPFSFRRLSPTSSTWRLCWQC